MLTKAQWLFKKRRKRKIILITSFTMIIFGLILFVVASFWDLPNHITMNPISYTILNFTKTSKTIPNVELTKMLLTPNEYSRPQTPLEQVNSVVIHYTANPGTSAKSNRNYFEDLKDEKSTSASSHFVIGLEGEIIQCVPLDEIAYASNDRNFDTISIECCHPDETGEFNIKTYKALVSLVAWICCEYKLEKEDIIRHYDVSGKNCPLYYVEHEDEWKDFKDDVMAYIDANVIEE